MRTPVPGGLRVAIVGAGLMGRWHAYYAAKAGATIVAIVDLDARSAAELGRTYPSAHLLRDLSACLTRCDVHAVHICTPPASHAALAMEALASGKHVLVEKPLAPSLDETERLIDLARHNGVLLNPTHQFPYQRGVQRLSRHVNRLGTPVRVAFTACSAGGAQLAPHERRALLLEILPHPLALFRTVLGADVSDISWDLLCLTDDELEIRGTLRDVQVHGFLSLRGRPPRNFLTVIGTEGTAHADLFHGYSVTEGGRPSRRTKLLQPFGFGNKLLLAAGSNLVWRAVTGETAYPGLGALIARFHEAIARRGEPPIGAAEMLDVAALSERLRSAPAGGE